MMAPANGHFVDHRAGLGHHHIGAKNAWFRRQRKAGHPGKRV